MIRVSIMVGHIKVRDTIRYTVRVRTGRGRVMARHLQNPELGQTLTLALALALTLTLALTLIRTLTLILTITLSLTEALIRVRVRVRISIRIRVRRFMSNE